MSKFVIVKKAPASLGKGEVALSEPGFVDEVRAKSRKVIKNRLTTLHHMRDILNAIQQRYEVDLNLFKIPLALYCGLAYSNEEELNSIVVKLLKKERPDVFEKVLEYNIKNRPYGTKLIYYVGTLQDTTPFFRQGMDMIEEKDVDEYLGRKPKKIVGKPAITNAEAEELAG